LPPQTAGTPASIGAELRRIGNLTRTLCHAEALSAAQALDCTAPDHRDVLYLMAMNLRGLNRIDEALACLARLESLHPRFSGLHQERGHCDASRRDVARAIEAFECAVRINPALALSWTLLERLYRMTGRPDRAAAAASQAAALRALPPQVLRAASLACDGELDEAEPMVRAYLREDPGHVEALRLLARVLLQRGAADEAERLLAEIVERVPHDRSARADLARARIDALKHRSALEVVDGLLMLDPDNPHWQALRAAACLGLGRAGDAIALYRRLLEGAPRSPELNVAFGDALKAIGQREEAISAYRAAIAARAGFGDAYWSLANLKTHRFSAQEIEDMRLAESVAATRIVDRVPLCFALGRALGDVGDHEASWRFYERGNALKRAELGYRPQRLEAQCREQAAVCTAPFFAARAGVGATDADPIFIVGLPRSGSTLIEQILASHARVEGTSELPEIPRIVRELVGAPSDPGYPAILAELPHETFRELGDRYLKAARDHRTSGRPFFIDKMPNNFRHVGLIHLMLPNARILDVRRESMACCFSNLKQLFASGQEFTYGVEDIARYYRMYLVLMQHWDHALPGRVLHIDYEAVVEDLVPSVRRILDHCGLSFDPACVNFHRTERTIRTPSSEQVRQPIYRDGLAPHKPYEAWLGPLREALGVAAAMPAVQSSTT
jgi:tetratricopeptide (TPR) repeat protein